MLQGYRSASDLADHIPVFPLRNAILLPGTNLPFRIFEPRYLEMIDKVLSGDRLLGMLQPLRIEGDDSESPQGKDVQLHDVGCVGRLTAFNENDDRTLHIQLSGICRFKAKQEIVTEAPFRTFQVDYLPFENDLIEGYGENDVDRGVLLNVLRTYLNANDMETDWEAIQKASTDHIVNTLSVLSPYDCEEKQALLEANSLRERSEILIALAEMELASGGSGNTNLQ